MRTTPTRRARAVGLAATVLAAGGYGCGSSAQQPRAQAPPAAHTASMTAHAAALIHRPRILSTARVPIDNPPLEAGLGAVWSASSSGLVRLALPAGRAKVIVHEPVDDLALSSTRVYALSIAHQELLEVDPSSLKVTRRWRVGSDAHSITIGDQAVYVASASAPVEIERVDPQTDAVRHSVIRGAATLSRDQAIAIGAGKLWVTDGAKVYRLNPKSLSLLGSTPLGGIDDVWFGEGSLWAASETPNGGVERIDPATQRVVARSDADAIQIAFSPTAVWLAAAAGPTAVDPTTAKTIAAVSPMQALSSGSAGIALVGHQVWITYTDIKKLQRLLP